MKINTDNRWLKGMRILALLAALAGLGLLAVLPLGWQDQAVVGGMLFLFAVWINSRSSSYPTTLGLMVLSMFCTVRYLHWRFSETFGYLMFNQSEIASWEILPVFLLLFAEAYGFVIMVLGFFQALRPLWRKPTALPDDPDLWPTVDVFVPTFNEPIEIVRPTVLATMHMDWPKDKINIYVLDDGRRAEIRAFAEECGVGYITRADNSHAKAGNLNNALAQTTGEFVAFFDSDHIPTRAFLQMTMGPFLKDDRLGLVQAPHLFYSPDPFEQNLNVFRKAPNEGSLFYGVIQQGNDFWNASFFCGSCAVIRRQSLDEIGGIAVESVTEDSLTSVKMQSKGWNSVFLGIPLAAGLATSTLRDHMRQRIRWARGMIQVLRITNPLFGKGLSWPQRLCYLNSTIHFLHAAPRLIFLTAPLAYLLFGISNLYGYVWAILAYALPHIAIATLTSARVQGQFRRAFWNEFYETVLSPFILLPTLMTLISPSTGKFNVTPKTRFLDRYQFDLAIVAPYLILIALNLIGIAMVLPRMFSETAQAGTLSINIFWALYNVLFLGPAIALGWQAPQRRKNERVPVQLPGALSSQNGYFTDFETEDMSMGGASVRLPLPCSLRAGDRATVQFPAYSELSFPAKVIEAEGLHLRLDFVDLQLAHHDGLTQIIFSRPDAWLDWRFERQKFVKPLTSLAGLLVLGARSLVDLPRGLRTALTSSASTTSTTPRKRQPVLPLILLLVAAAVFFAVRGMAQTPVPEPTPSASELSFSETHNLLSLGQDRPVVLRSGGDSFKFRFGIPVSKVVYGAELLLRYRTSELLDPSKSRIRILLNDAPVDEALLSEPEVSKTASVTIVPLSADTLMSDNVLEFELIARCRNGCDETLSAEDLWVRIEASTQIRLRGTRLPLANDVQTLPAPFHDPSAQKTVELPVIFSETPNRETLQAAGVITSWFGVLADHRGLHSPVWIDKIPAGNAVVLASPGTRLAREFNLDGVTDPVVGVRDNPNDPFGKVLLIAGANGDQILQAARALAVGQVPASGATAAITDFRLPPAVAAYEVPRWLKPNRTTPLTDFVGGENLRIYGSDTRKLYFRLPPDLHYGNRTWIPLHFHYRYSGMTPGGSATIRVELNKILVKQEKITAQLSTEVRREMIPLPVDDLYTGNTLTVQVTFEDGEQTERRETRAYPEAEILASSGLELPELRHFVEMPALELFANAGFPFTRVPDLSETAVVLPDDPSLEQISLYLDLVAFFGANTGYPGLRVSVLTPAEAAQVENLDLAVIGSATDQPLFKLWESDLAISLTSDRMRLNSLKSPWEHLQALPWTTPGRERAKLSTLLRLGDAPLAAILGMASPNGPGRSVVALATADRWDVNPLTDLLTNSLEPGRIYGSVSVVQDNRYHSYRLGIGAYHSGSQGWGETFDYWMHRYVWLIPLLVLLLTRLAALSVEGWIQRRAKLRLETVA